MTRSPGSRPWLASTILLATASCTVFSAERQAPPNIVLLVATDLGYAELGCYGQRLITTPYLDSLAAGGLRFTQAYAGSSVVAPAIASLLTGRHSGHLSIRDHRDFATAGGSGGQTPLPDAERTLAELLGDHGFATAAIGCWPLGGANTTGHPQRQGFDSFFGHLSQRNAERPYPPYLWRGTERIELAGNAAGQRRDFGQDMMVDEAMQFLGRQTAARPFFLHLALPSPGPGLLVPADSLAQYKGLWHETAYQRPGYPSQATPRAAHAARITRTDEQVGRILNLLRRRRLLDNTLILFTSSNGPSDQGGVDTEFFASATPLRGHKASLYEGGLRVPLIMHWPAQIRPASVSHLVTAAWDLLPTVVELLGISPPTELDGVSLVPTLLGRPAEQAHHGFLYWERAGQQAVRMGRWKALRTSPDATLELFDLVEDITERRNVAAAQAGLIRQIELILEVARTPSAQFPLRH